MANTKGSGVNRLVKSELADSKLKGEAFKKQLYKAFDNADKVNPKKKQEKK
jgi:hypothetical protein